ncbi:MAG TPA: M4 family metallopeptidase [Kofleriaceae bacterium]
MKKLCGVLAALTIASCADDPDAAPGVDPAPTIAPALQAVGTTQAPVALVRTAGVKLEDDAVAAVRARRVDLGLSATLDDFKLMSTTRGMDGLDHVRLQQLHGGVPVWGGDIVVHADANSFTGLGGNLAALQGVATNPAVSAASALAFAKADYARTAQPGAQLAYVHEAQDLVILPSAKGVAHLAWHVTFFTDPQGGLRAGRWNYFIDALNGTILDQFNGLATTEGSGYGGNAKVSRYWNANLDISNSGGNSWIMDAPKFKTNNVNHGWDVWDDPNNPPGGGCPHACAKTDGWVEAIGTVFSSSSTTFTDTAGNDAHGFTKITLNALSDWFGYNSIDNAGYKVLSRVHYSTNYSNAFWNGTDMAYGDGDGTHYYPMSGGLDVVAHEINHGFTEKHSNLPVDYTMAAAMNESFSDIAATAAKFYYSPSTASFDIGRDVRVTNTALRYMCDPTTDTMSIDNAANFPVGGMDPHYSSGVMNKAFCRSARRLSGVDPNTGAATAAGVQQAAKAWYAANAGYWTSSSTFTQGCQGVVDAALALGYSPAQVELIGQSWDEVGVACNYPMVVGGGVTGDFNGDGYADLMALYQYPGNAVAGLWVFPGTAGSGSTASVPYRAWYAGPNALDVSATQVAAGDFNGDGLTDVLLLDDYGSSEARLFVVPGTTTVGANVTSPYSVWHAATGTFNAKKAKLTAGKFNGDAYADALVLFDNGNLSASLLVIPGTTATGDTATAPYTVWTTPTGSFDFSRTKITAGDFNGDGKADVIGLYDYSNVYGPGSAGIFIWPGTAGHTSTSSAAYRAWFGGQNSLDYHRCKIAGGDFDGDNKADLMVLYDYGAGAAGLFVFPGTTATGDTATSAHLRWSVPSGYFESKNAKITAGDFNGDHKADLVSLYDYGAGSAGLFVWPGAAGTGMVTSYVAWSAGPGNFEVPRARVP